MTAAPHLSAEQLAAFAEGRLSGDERNRAVTHVADCDDCRELLADTVELLRDLPEESGDEPVPADEPDEEGTAGAWPPPPTETTDRRGAPPPYAVWALAAVLALLVWTAVDRWILTAPTTTHVAELTSDLPIPPDELLDPDRQGWSIYLGTGDTVTGDDTTAFRLGWKVCSLEVALRVGASDEAVRLTHRMETGAEALGLLGVEQPLLEIRSGLETARAPTGGAATGDPLPDLLAANALADELLTEAHAGDRRRADLYLLGKWTCAARLAAATGDAAWFSRRAPRRTLDRLADAELPESLVAPFDALARLAAGEPTARDLAEIERRAGRLIRLAGDISGDD